MNVLRDNKRGDLLLGELATTIHLDTRAQVFRKRDFVSDVVDLTASKSKTSIILATRGSANRAQQWQLAAARTSKGSASLPNKQHSDRVEADLQRRSTLVHHQCHN